MVFKAIGCCFYCSLYWFWKSELDKCLLGGQKSFWERPPVAESQEAWPQTPLNSLEPALKFNLSLEKSGNFIPSGDWTPCVMHLLSDSAHVWEIFKRHYQISPSKTDLINVFLWRVQNLNSSAFSYMRAMGGTLPPQSFASTTEISHNNRVYLKKYWKKTEPPLPNYVRGGRLNPILPGGGGGIYPLLFFLHHPKTAQGIKLKLFGFKDTPLRHILQVRPVRYILSCCHGNKIT